MIACARHVQRRAAVGVLRVWLGTMLQKARGNFQLAHIAPMRGRRWLLMQLDASGASENGRDAGRHQGCHQDGNGAEGANFAQREPHSRNVKWRVAILICGVDGRTRLYQLLAKRGLAFACGGVQRQPGDRGEIAGDRGQSSWRSQGGLREISWRSQGHGDELSGDYVLPLNVLPLLATRCPLPTGHRRPAPPSPPSGQWVWATLDDPERRGAVGTDTARALSHAHLSAYASSSSASSSGASELITGPAKPLENLASWGQRSGRL